MATSIFPFLPLWLSRRRSLLLCNTPAFALYRFLPSFSLSLSPSPHFAQLSICPILVPPSSHPLPQRPHNSSADRVSMAFWVRGGGGGEPPQAPAHECYGAYHDRDMRPRELVPFDSRQPDNYSFSREAQCPSHHLPRPPSASQDFRHTVSCAVPSRLRTRRIQREEQKNRRTEEQSC